MNPTTKSDVKASQDSEYQRWRGPLEGILGIPFSAGNRVDVLHNGDEIFPAMLEAITQARERIDFLTFVYWSGAIAQRFAQTLADKAADGVVVNVLLDSFGAKKMSEEQVDLMRSAGVNVQWFRPLAKWRLWQTDNRTHRKVLIVDGKLGFTGGVGIAAEWEGDARNPTEWRDTHFRIQGPAVYALQGAFLGNWAETGQPVHKAGDTTRMLEPQGDVWIQLIRTTASIGWSDIATLLRVLIVEARHHIRITTAYFVPDEDTLLVLCAAAARGVTVEVMMPGPHSDARISQLAGEDEFRQLLDAGVRLWSYQRTMLHTKVITVDGLLACVGSANFNQRSMRKDDEISVVMLSREITALLDRHFMEDQTACEPIRPEDWQKRGWIQRALESVSKLIKSQV
ncbi:MAG: phospholipase D-like domain-containing protein [Candidatus Competibacteraceae bacterium]|jgi:cardiolipin synthase|nr:phospholipase D-like domain-containing protein [Candidatus Competibacteraceae bacterium]